MTASQYNKDDIQARRIFSSGQEGNTSKPNFNTINYSRAENSGSQNQSSERPMTNHGSVN